MQMQSNYNNAAGFMRDAPLLELTLLVVQQGNSI